MKKLLFIVLIFIIMSCSQDEERPNYNVIENTIPNSSFTLKWSQSNGFENQNKVLKSLNRNNKKIFSQSLSWISTESNIKLEILNGKSAKQFVDLVNCLKTNKSESICVGE